MTKRDERIQKLKADIPLYGLTNREMRWLIDELEKEIERGRKLRDAAKKTIIAKRGYAQDDAMFQLSETLDAINAEYDQESEK